MRKIVAVLLGLVLALPLASCNNASDVENGRKDTGNNMVENAIDDIGDAFDHDGMGNDDIYDRGTADDNGINTNEGSADGGTRTAEDNSAIWNADKAYDANGVTSHAAFNG